MSMAMGFVETRGIVAAIEAADAMVKAANVIISEFRLVGSGLVSVVVSGEVAAVQAAVEAGGNAAALVGEINSVNVIPSPDSRLALELFTE